MKILLVAATVFEILPQLNRLGLSNMPGPGQAIQSDGLEIHFLVTGVGMHATAWHLASVLSQKSFDLVINAGVAGALDPNLNPGEVVFVVSEQFGDLGAEDADGSFLSLSDMGLLSPNTPPFSEGKLINPRAEDVQFLPGVQGITVNTVTGTKASIEEIRKRFPEAQIETMESAAVFFGCLESQTPFMGIRSISNYVEPRNRDNWELEKAIQSLNSTLEDILKGLSTK